MRRFILGIVFVVLASQHIQAWFIQREYRDEYTSDKEFIRVLANLTQVPDDIPDEATEVILTFNMITDIPINVFSNFQDCWRLELSYNEISRIGPGMFNGLNSLIQLFLSYNQITTLDDDSFDTLISLRELFINDNKITTISDKTFSSLPACFQLNLKINNISIIPKGAFTSLSSLRTIYLNENNIQTIPENAFPNNSIQLLLGSNKISALENVAYTNLVFLTSFSLINNSISTIPANTFTTLSNCEDLSLSHNPIEIIEDGAFHGLDKLTILSLYKTSLTHLTQNMFEGLPLLKHLRLDNCRISEIERGALKGLDFLQTLTLFQNELTVIESYTFSGLFSLKVLVLQNNNINDIKDFSFLSLGNLTRLHLYNNQLEHLRPSTFAGLGSLESLDLGDNKLTTIDPLVLSPLPRPLELAMDALLTPIPMVCDVKLCWLKVEEEAGNIVWNSNLYVFGRDTDVYYPTCTGGVDWRSLQCPGTLPCSDPGEVDFAERSGSYLPFKNNSQPGLGLPYSSDSELIYTCDPCYTGGGTITCQSNAQWTRKPECVRLDNKVVCRAPVLVEGYLTPSYDQYECGVKVTFTCNQGSTQTVGVCGPDGQFIGDISSCVKNGETVTATEGPGIETATDSPTTDSPDQGTKPESGANQEGSSGLIYSIVGAVGGIVLMAFIGLTVFCIKRSKKRNPSDVDTTRTQNTVTDGGYIGIVTEGNGLYEKAGDGASDSGYMDINTPATDRGTPGQPDATVYSNKAYEDEYQEIEDALPKDDPVADVDEDAYEN